MILDIVRSRNPRLILIGVIVALLAAGGILFVGIVKPRSNLERIQVAKVWSDSVDAQAGRVYYLLDVNASMSGPPRWRVDPTFFLLTSNTSASYQSTLLYNMTALMGVSTINPGQSIQGEVAFNLPMKQVPMRLSYSDPGNGIQVQTTGIPATSATASKFDPSVHYMFNGSSAATAVTVWAAITNQSNGLTFFGNEQGYRSYDFVFFTGQKIYVTFALYYYRFPYDPNTIEVRSVCSDDGYIISDVQAWQANYLGNGPEPLPVFMTGYGSNVEVTLLATVPPGPQPGVLHFTLQFSS